MPSKTTFCRVASSLDPKQFKECFLNWIKEVQTELVEVVAINGKTLRCSFDKANNQSAVHMVSAFSAEAKLVLTQQKVDEKSNEITAIPKLLELLDLNDAVVTIDAMGCQKTITEKIVKKGGDYAIALKGNQGNLHGQIAKYFTHFFEMIYHKSVDATRVDEVNRGRVEQRSCLATSELD